jgi:hypothetical protein
MRLPEGAVHLQKSSTAKKLRSALDFGFTPYAVIVKIQEMKESSISWLRVRKILLAGSRTSQS